ncbi:MAG: glycosyltransferase, partial [Candidatus Pacebacteria bacterium]|nr:glycosyltransferase [Candidatus Paceibacterota bacterium]
MTAKATVSAVIPSFNGLELLKKHLPAVLVCLRNKDELVIVDDASTDQTAAWLRKKFHCRKQVFQDFPGVKLVGKYQTSRK